MRPVKVKDLHEGFIKLNAKILAREAAISVRASHNPPNVESNIIHGPKRADSFEEINQRVHIHIHSIRKRLADCDGVSAKAAIDGIVQSGLLKDDDLDHVSAVTYSQEKGKPEGTVISIYEETKETEAIKRRVD